MQEARILHCEDSPIWQETVAMLLAVRGVHKVVSVAETPGEAQQRLEEIREGRLAANVLMMDGHLRGGMGMNHPRVIKMRADELGLRIPIIGLSINGLSAMGMNEEDGLVADILKGYNNADVLDRVLDELPEPS